MQSKISAKPDDLEAVYVQAKWKEHGFTYKQFLKWGTIDQGYQNSLLGDLQDFLPHDSSSLNNDTLFQDILLPGQSDDQPHYLVNPEWANPWKKKRVASDSLAAAKWQVFGFSPEHARLIKKLGYKTPETAHDPYITLLRSGLFDYMEQHDLFSFQGIKNPWLNGKKPEVDGGRQDEGFINVFKFITDPGTISNKQRDMIMKNLVPPATVYEGSSGWGVMSNFNSLVERRITSFSTALDVIQSRGWDIPDEDGVLPIMLRYLCLVNKYEDSFIKTILDNVSEFDDFCEIMTKFDEANRQDPEFRKSEHNNYCLLYSYLNDVPFSWVTHDLISDFIEKRNIKEM